MVLLRLIAQAAIAAFIVVAAQQRLLAQEPPSSSGLVVQLTPYIWLPTINTTMNFPVPGGGTANTTVSSGPGDYIPKLNFGAMFAGEVHYDRFSLLTDFMYLNANTSKGRIRSFDFGLTSIPVDRVVSTSTSIRVESAVWTLAGGYTVAEGSWGNLDVIAGFRLLYADETTDFSLSAAIIRPDGSVALGRGGSLKASRDVWNGIGGVRGRIYIANADWFGGGRIYVPYYFDVGGGGSRPTWQVFSGLGYQAGILGVSVGYRYLSFQQGNSSLVPKLTLGGPIIAATITF